MAATKITDHSARALARQWGIYSENPNISWLIERMASQVQEAEDAFYQLIAERWLDTAVGNQLDMLGEILGVDRNALDDDDYRLALKAAVARYKSSGRPEQVITSFKLLVESDRVFLSEVFPAEVNITAVGSIDAIGSGSAILEAMDKTLAAGVSFDAMILADENPFVFDGYPFPEGRGFGTVTDPSIGGVFASILS